MANEVARAVELTARQRGLSEEEVREACKAVFEDLNTAPEHVAIARTWSANLRELEAKHDP